MGWRCPAAPSRCRSVPVPSYPLSGCDLLFGAGEVGAEFQEKRLVGPVEFDLEPCIALGGVQRRFGSHMPSQSATTMLCSNIWSCLALKCYLSVSYRLFLGVRLVLLRLCSARRG